MFKTLCAQERTRAKRKAIFELRAATIIKNNPHICTRTCPRRTCSYKDLHSVINPEKTKKRPSLVSASKGAGPPFFRGIPGPSLQPLAFGFRFLEFWVLDVILHRCCN